VYVNWPGEGSGFEPGGVPGGSAQNVEIVSDSRVGSTFWAQSAQNVEASTGTVVISTFWAFAPAPVEIGPDPPAGSTFSTPDRTPLPSPAAVDVHQRRRKAERTRRKRAPRRAARR
jgi:hypothetical protein